MKIAAIIPVKTFSKAKTRLNISDDKKEELCKVMLDEVLKTISDSKIIDRMVVVSKDENALKASKQFRSVQIFDNNESGVNNAVSLADDYLNNTDFDASIVFPQDIPFMQTLDVENLLKLQNSTKSALIVPSRRFDGTNALFRMPTNLMETHYDEDSYKIHLNVGKSHSHQTSLVLIRRIMLDIDNQADLDFVLLQNEKPLLTKKLENFSNQTY